MSKFRQLFKLYWIFSFVLLIALYVSFAHYGTKLYPNNAHAYELYLKALRMNSFSLIKFSFVSIFLITLILIFKSRFLFVFFISEFSNLVSDIQYLRVNSFSEKMTPVASLYESLYLIIFINIFVSTAIVFYLIDKERKHDFMYHSRHSNTFKSITLAETHEVLELEYKRLVTEYPKIKKHIAKAYSYKKSLLDPLLAPIYSKAVHDIQNATDFQDLDSKYYAAIRTHPEIGNRLTKLFKQEKLKFNKK